MSEDEEIDNKFWQQSRLVDYYNQIPVIQFMFKSTEADDIIAYVSQHKLLKDHHKIILSSDKDFFQLLDERTVLYRPIQKEVLNRKNIVEKFDIHPTNFALARAMAGDSDDNITIGVARVDEVDAAEFSPDPTPVEEDPIPAETTTALLFEE